MTTPPSRALIAVSEFQISPLPRAVLSSDDFVVVSLFTPSQYSGCADQSPPCTALTLQRLSPPHLSQRTGPALVFLPQITGTAQAARLCQSYFAARSAHPSLSRPCRKRSAYSGLPSFSLHS